MDIKFSIIVVCYNAGTKLSHTIDNILEQSYGNYEIIIKDGMSEDSSLLRIPVSHRTHVVSCRDKGIYDAMNQAVHLAEGDYYLFMNCGDSFYDEWVLEKTAREIHNKCQGTSPEKPLIFYGDTYDEIGQTKVSMNRKITPFTCYRHIPCHQACIYAAELFKERQYDLQYVIRADYEHFLWSYFRKEANPCYLDFVVANYEGGGFSETKENRKRDKEEHRRITEQYLPKNKLFLYRMAMAVTLAPVRRYISRNAWLSGVYNKAKQFFYGKKKRG